MIIVTERIYLADDDIQPSEFHLLDITCQSTET